MRVITNRDLVYHFFKEALGTYYSEDLRGMCFFADEDSKYGSPMRREDVAVAVMFNGFIGRIAQMHVVVQKPEKLTRKMVRETFHYAFEQCGLVAVFGLVDSKNDAAIKFDEKLGFERIHTISNGGLEGDFILFQMTKSQCRWLRSNHGQEKRATCA